MKKIMIYPIVALVAILVLWSVWGFFGSRVEQAEYSVVKKTKDYEIREYPAHLVAQATVAGAPDEALSSGFRIVAGYIFGGNVRKESIAMTAPVVAEKGERIAMTAPVVATTEGQTQTISFGMPRGHTLETLPTPTDPRVKIVAVPAKKYAALRFSGYRTEGRIQAMQEELRAALARDGVTIHGSLAYAGYNAPWTPPWMTRHEVLAEVR